MRRTRTNRDYKRLYYLLEIVICPVAIFDSSHGRKPVGKRMAHETEPRRGD